MVRVFTPWKLANATNQGGGGWCVCVYFFPESWFTNTILCLHKNILFQDVKCKENISTKFGKF